MLHTIKVEDKFSELQSSLSIYFPWHQARIKFLIHMVVAMSKLHTVCFERLAEGFEGNAMVSSRLRRIQRFFAAFLVDNDLIAKFLFALLPQQTGLRISIDRTNWQFGKTDINIFMLSVCHEGMALPLMWTMLDKRGSSNSLERIALIERFLSSALFQIFQNKSLKPLLGLHRCFDFGCPSRFCFTFGYVCQT